MLNLAVESHLKTYELEGFLSCIQYNKMSQAKVSDLTEAIYEIDEKDWDIRMQQKIKNPPPPKESLLAFVEDRQEG